MSPTGYKKERQRRGLTQAALAVLLGIRQSTVSDRERGRREITREAELAIKSLPANPKIRRYKMKTITAAEIIKKHNSELDYAPNGEELTIREMLADEPKTQWAILEDEEKVTSYVARFVGQASPVVLAIYDAVEPVWEVEAGAEETLRNIRMLDEPGKNLELFS